MAQSYHPSVPAEHRLHWSRKAQVLGPPAMQGAALARVGKILLDTAERGMVAVGQGMGR